MTEVKSSRKRKSDLSSESKRRKSLVVRCPTINQKYHEEKFVTEFRANFKAEPFPHWHLRNFVHNDGNFVEEVEAELQNFGEWKRRENDLYSLHQTEDFKSLAVTKYPSLYSFRQFLYNEVREFLTKVTGVQLTDQVDCNGSCYAHTDSLLPHNDLIDTRHFAFVYYLTEPNWNSKKFGGNLQLFNVDKKGFPSVLAKEIPPLRNSLVVFEVSQKSWHKVAEIISNTPRLSINGWFHSERKPKAVTPPVEIYPKMTPTESQKIKSIFGAEYFDTEKQKKVQDFFGDNSELSLKKFLKDNVHDAIYEELEANPSLFELTGPVNKRQIHKLKENETLQVTNTLIRAMKSKNFTKLMGKLTGVKLTGSQVSLKVIKVQQGSYWVLGDEDAQQSAAEGYCLDVHIFVQKQPWDDDFGGMLVYIAEDEEEELLQVSPGANETGVVFREPGVLSFLKYVNSKAADKHYYLLTLSYHNVDVVD